jgi:lysophospholipase L1-like esterase
LSSDNVHPNVSGYAWMAGVWYDTISPLLPK